MKGLKKDSNEDMELYKRLKILKDIMKIRFYPQVEIEN